MKQAIIHIALAVRGYDEVIEFYTNKLHFTPVGDTYQSQQDKHRVVVSPPGSNATTILFVKAFKPRQEALTGDQAGGCAFLFLATDDFKRDYRDMRKNGIHFAREPKEADYGIVAVFEDLYGSLWDLVQFQEGHPMCKHL